MKVQRSMCGSVRVGKEQVGWEENVGLKQVGWEENVGLKNVLKTKEGIVNGRCI